MAVITKPSEGLIQLENDKPYAAAAAKLAELEARVATLDQRRAELSVGIGRTQAARDVLTARAERLLQDAVVPLSNDAKMTAMRRDLGAVEDELGVVRRAVQLQRPIVEHERQRVSREICDRLRPRHRQIIGAIAAALEQLSTALQAEEALRSELIEAGVEFSTLLRPMPFAAAGRVDDPNSNASVWLADARAHGLVR
jgi:hypothetical protein